jgi:hypothetical protein
MSLLTRKTPGIGRPAATRWYATGGMVLRSCVNRTKPCAAAHPRTTSSEGRGQTDVPNTGEFAWRSEAGQAVDDILVEILIDEDLSHGIKPLARGAGKQFFVGKARVFV